MGLLHIYTERMQPATRFSIDVSKVYAKRQTLLWITCGGNSIAYTECCRKRRQCKNLYAQAYYDHTSYWCQPGTGCKKGKT